MKKNKKNIKLVYPKPRGFCAGVIRAEKILRTMLELYGFNEKIYVRKQIVHNRYIINLFTKQGIIFVDEIYDIPPNSIVVFSAHGVSPKVREKANKKGLIVVDATCPFVKMVHDNAIKYAKQGYHIIFIGNRNHEEAVGTTGESILIQEKYEQEGRKHGNTYIISSKKEAEAFTIKDTKPVICLSQTTLNTDQTDTIVRVLKDRLGERLIFPKTTHVCYATKNRQDALKNMIMDTGCELVFIIGSQNSSNSKRLVENARSLDIESYLIDSYRDIKEEWLNDRRIIGLSSGASAPEILIGEVIQYFHEHYTVEIEEYIFKEENVKLPIPNLEGLREK